MLVTLEPSLWFYFYKMLDRSESNFLLIDHLYTCLPVTTRTTQWFSQKWPLLELPECYIISLPNSRQNQHLVSISVQLLVSPHWKLHTIHYNFYFLALVPTALVAYRYPNLTIPFTPCFTIFQLFMYSSPRYWTQWWYKLLLRSFLLTRSYEPSW